MPIVDMSAGHIAAQLGFFEPQRQNNSLLRVNDLVGGFILTLSLESFPMPKIAINPVEAVYMNTKSKFAGVINIEDMSVIVRDFVDVTTALVLWDWLMQVHDFVTGRNGMARWYKKSGTVTSYSPGGAFDRELHIYGMWPNNFDPGDNDMSSDEIRKITMTISVDNVIPGLGFNSGRITI